MNVPTPPALGARKTSSRLANKKSEPETRTSGRKRGRPSSYYSSTSDDNDAKRRRDVSPSVTVNDVDEDDSDYDEDGEKKIDKNGRLLGGKVSYILSLFHCTVY